MIEEIDDSSTVLAIKKHQKRRLISRDSRPAFIGDGKLWHARMGYPGPMSLHMLDKNSLEVRL